MSHKAEPRPAILPATVGPYRIIGLLGRGGMGVVYRGRDEARGRDVAVKVLSTDAESDNEIRQRFLREANVTQTLRHRNVITILDVGEEAGRIFIATELLQGLTIGEGIKNGVRRTVQQNVDLLLQACDGLAAAHAKGIVHRDITPGNLFVQSDGGLKILDFGIARLADSKLTRSGLIMGTPGYLSPEQARGRRVDFRADIFSVAAVFYHTFTGRRPFEGPGLPAVLKKVIMDDPPPIREHEAPVGIAQILARALQKDPDRRYQRVAEMAAELIRLRREGGLDASVSAPTQIRHVEHQFDAVAGDMRTAATMDLKTTAYALSPKTSESDAALPMTGLGDTTTTTHVSDVESPAIGVDSAAPIR